MATPVSIRQRDAAIARSKERKAKAQSRQVSTIAQHPIQPHLNFSDDVEVHNFDHDDWQTSANSFHQPNLKFHQPLWNPKTTMTVIKKYKEIRVDKNNVEIFHGKDYYLSTFFEARFTISSHEYPTVETHYQACKLYCLINENIAAAIKTVKTPAQAKKVASNTLLKYNIPKSRINNWKWLYGNYVVYTATKEKIKAHPELRKKLLDTNDKLLIDCYKSDSIFASGCSREDLDVWLQKNDGKTIKVPLFEIYQNDEVTRIGKGCNMLGYIAMRIREELRQDEITSQSANNINFDHLHF